jgi:hypothetical protein
MNDKNLDNKYIAYLIKELGKADNREDLAYYASLILHECDYAEPVRIVCKNTLAYNSADIASTGD